MDAPIARAGAALLLIAAGMALGALLGEAAGWPRLGLAAGALAFAAAALLRDGARADRLLQWLRGTGSAGVPHHAGYWGELAYRVERALRERERTIEAERERLRQFLSAIEASPNGVLLLDADGRIDWLNAVAASQFGLDPQRDRQQRVTNLIRAPAFVDHLQAGRFEQPVIVAQPGCGSTLSVLVRPYGDGLKLVLSADITERERTEAMRRDFVANVSHEIRTPLTVLAGFVETLEALPLSEAERERALALMRQQTARMQVLVDDLLTLARLEGSPRPAADAWMSVQAVLAHAHADAQALSAGRHALAVGGGADADMAGSEAELASAVGNLLSNAVRYTPAGGHIELRWLWRADGGAAIEVADDGIGIAPEHLPRLTERFYRVDGSRSRETGGTGLGLAIVKHVAQRHGGEVDVHSTPGKGSTFRLVLPAARVRRHAAAEVGRAAR